MPDMSRNLKNIITEEITEGKCDLFQQGTRRCCSYNGASFFMQDPGSFPGRNNSQSSSSKATRRSSTMKLFNQVVMSNLQTWKAACDRGATLHDRMLLLQRLDNSLVTLIRSTNELCEISSKG